MTKNNEQIIINKDKFIEAENKPINEEAINKFIEDTNKFYIDGVDVSGCAEYCNGLCDTAANFYNEQIYCTNDPNCYYKNWKRKEQECEELKEKLDEMITQSALLPKFFALSAEEITQLTTKCSKLKQTLEEIRKLVEKEFCRHIECCEFCSNSNECLNRKILEKINEVIDGN